MLHEPTSKQKEKYAKYLSENEEIVAVTGIGSRYYAIVFTFYLVLTFIPIVLLIIAGMVNDFIWNREISLNITFLSPTNTLLILMGISLLISLFILYLVLPRLVHLMVLKRSKLYIFTNRRVMLKEGIFSVKLTSAPYDKITHNSTVENFIEKLLFNVGDIIIHTAGPTPVELKLYHLSDAIAMKNVLEGLIIKERHQPLGVVDSGLGKEKNGLGSDKIHRVNL